MTPFENLLVEREGAVVVLTINRPKQLNALNSAVLGELVRALTELQAEVDPIRALILTGAGEKAFVAGADIAEMAPIAPRAARELSELGHHVMHLLSSSPFATIAAINGFALGGGLELATACDLQYASENAKLGQPEVNLGIIPGFGGTQRLTRLVGKARAKELVLTGDLVDAKRAAEIGLVLEVFPREALLPKCKEVAAKIASKAPLAVAKAKEAIEQGFDLPLAAANRLEIDTFGLLFDTQDRREGMAAFVERRQAKFTGK